MSTRYVKGIAELFYFSYLIDLMRQYKDYSLYVRGKWSCFVFIDVLLRVHCSMQSLAVWSLATVRVCTLTRDDLHLLLMGELPSQQEVRGRAAPLVEFGKRGFFIGRRVRVACCNIAIAHVRLLFGITFLQNSEQFLGVRVDQRSYFHIVSLLDVRE